MRIALTGGTGLIGGLLARQLIDDGHELVFLARSTGKTAAAFPQSDLIAWDAIAEEPPVRLMKGVEAAVHLAGENPAAGRWNKQRKEAIRDSRVIGTRNLVGCLVKCDPPPRILLSASAVGYYGPRGEESLDESSEPGEGFLAQVAQRWESEAEPALQAGIRTVFLRSGVVLATQGGALKAMLPLFRRFLGGRMGNGNQWMSWIHIEDHLEAIRFALKESKLEGPLNLTAPNPVTNREFTRSLAQAVGRPAWLPAPGFGLKLLLGEMAQEMLLNGQRVEPVKLLQFGFQFQYPKLEGALSNLLDQERL